MHSYFLVICIDRGNEKKIIKEILLKYGSVKTVKWNSRVVRSVVHSFHKEELRWYYSTLSQFYPIRLADLLSLYSLIKHLNINIQYSRHNYNIRLACNVSVHSSHDTVPLNALMWEKYLILLLLFLYFLIYQTSLITPVGLYRVLCAS